MGVRFRRRLRLRFARPFDQEAFDQEALDQEAFDQEALDQASFDAPSQRLPVIEIANVSWTAGGRTRGCNH